jgi:Zn finger protein HypA/HybF involved in hydrogenase expression
MIIIGSMGKEFRCQRKNCKHEWESRLKDKIPDACPLCHSPNIKEKNE